MYKSRLPYPCFTVNSNCSYTEPESGTKNPKLVKKESKAYPNYPKFVCRLRASVNRNAKTKKESTAACFSSGLCVRD